ncbi:MAG TPA: arginase family protein [Solirubrobacterales bacterium]
MDDLVLIGVPVDSVGRSGGTELGPGALRELGLAEAVRAEDRGDLDLSIRGEERDPETGIVAAADVLAATEEIRAAVAALVGEGRRPLLAGGCCSELPGALAGARDAVGPVGLAHVDGHADLYDGRTSTTGEAADMPISVVLGLGPRRWVEAAGGPGAEAERTLLIGYRDRKESIADGMRQPEQLEPAPGLHPIERVRSDGARETGELAAAILAGTGPFWLHLDVDVLDQAAFPATDYLMSGGMSWEELDQLLPPLLSAERLIGASIACYNPEKDPDCACGRALIHSLRPLGPRLAG